MRAAQTFFLSTFCLLTACADPAARAVSDAEALTFERRPAEALRRYEDAILLLAKKEDGESQSLLRRSLMGAGTLSHLDLQDPRLALGYFQSLLQLFPASSEAAQARLTLFEIHRSLGDSQSAVAQLLALCQDFADHPENDRHMSLLAREYMAQGNHEQAVVEADLLLRRHPESPLAPEALMLRGNALGLLQRPQEAIDAYAQVIQRWPTSPLVSQARYGWARALIGLNRDAEAEPLLMEALREHPQPKIIQRELASVRERLMRRKVASPVNSLQALSAGQ